MVLRLDPLSVPDARVAGSAQRARGAGLEAGCAAARAAKRGCSRHARPTSSSSQAGSSPTGAAPSAWMPTRRREPLATAAGLPAAVNHAMAASDGHRLYVVGGYGAPDARVLLSRSAAGGGCPTCPSRERRRAPRSSAARSTCRRRRCGGLAQKSLAFDLRRRRWTRIPGPKPREHLGVTRLGRPRLRRGGRESGTNFDAFQAYLPKRRRWVSLATRARDARRHRCRPRSARCSSRPGASRPRAPRPRSTRSTCAPAAGAALPDLPTAEARARRRSRSTAVFTSSAEGRRLASR